MDLRIPIADEAGSIVKARFQEFLQTFQLVTADEMDMTTQQKLLGDYMAQITTMVQNNKSTVYVNFQHVVQADHELSEAIEMEYYRFEPYLRHAVQDIVALDNPTYIIDVDKGQREFFVSFYNQSRIDRIRSMGSDKIGRLISVSGTVTRSSEVRPELYYGSFICRDCMATSPAVEQQFQYTEPQVCRNPQCTKGSGGFQIMLDKSAFVDWQRLRVQENADEIPPGSMPRCVDIICRNEIVEVAKAGDKVVLTGTVAVIPDTSGLARVGESTVSGKASGRTDNNMGGVEGLKKLGVKELTYKLIFIACTVQNTDQRTGSALASSMLANAFEEGEGGGETTDATTSLSDNDKAEILQMRNTPHLYNKMVESICPSVFGHLEVKRGILLMLFGGVHKSTAEGISLRGDLNVCIVGDPSCAKSQFLKYVHGFLPRTVYTSGKSSSAAGLTATVVRDADTGEFCVEAGALMLADNGICCIDEFDKMDPNDQVAIHEAMEQQTISITKAGIQATLNARTSILAAANPVFGRYDRTKTLKANVAVSAAIMSRFDLFFVILDECNPEIDEAIARHIIGVHKEDGIQKVSTEVTFSREQIQKYIQFARCLNPIVTKESRKVLVECYRLLRSNDILGKNKTAYRITVRQLESLVRLSEALARLHLDEFVQPVYVKEAYRLLQKSIIFVETEDIELEDNEEEMNQLNSDTRSGSGSKRSRSDSAGEEPVNYRDENRENDEAVVNRVIQSKQEEGEETYRQELPSEGKAEPELQPEPQLAKKQKVKTHITAKDYENMTQLLAHHLKVAETKTEAAEAEGGGGAAGAGAGYVGMTWEDLVAQYVDQFKHEYTTSEELEEKIKLVNQVIRRMIKHESSIMIVHQDIPNYEDLPNNQKILRLHPSYQA